MQVELDEQGYTLDKKWKLVPVEPVDFQQHEGAQAIRIDTTLINKMFTANRVYRDMVSASPTPDLSGIKSVKNIPVGGEITEEFEKAGKEMWCKHCGSGISFESHLPSCPTLKSKL